MGRDFRRARTSLTRPPVVVPAVREVTLDIAAGERFGLVGESGSGKSTVGQVLAGLVPATSGSVRVCDVDLREASEIAASGKVAGAVAIPRGLLEFKADPSHAMHEAAMDPSKTVVTYCASGGRAM